LEQQISESAATVDRIVQLITDKKGNDIVVIDLRKVTSVADFFVIATGNSNVHVKAIADEVREKLRNELRIHPWHVEGEAGQRWILIDYVDIVVHVFDRQTREYYDIEGLYRDADIRRVETNN
jgi:ribosome-associated protein